MSRTILKVCLCGKKFLVYTYPSRILTSRGKYCSLACKYKYRERPKGLKYKIKVKNKSWFKNGHTPWHTGKRGLHLSPQSEIKKGQSIGIKTQFKKELIPWNKGKEYFQIKGEKHPRWKGGITPQNQKEYHSLKYKLWRKAVFEKDNYTCQKCGAKGIFLEAHHIYPHSMSSELKYNISNGQTLCVKCHNLTKLGRKTKKLCVA